MKLADDRITVASANLLAFEAGIDWNIRKVEGASGVLAGGLFNLELTGSGSVALLSHGPPLMIELDGTTHLRRPAGGDHLVERRASTSIKTDVGLKTLIGRTSGESLQMAFEGEGWLLIQPSEGAVGRVAQASGGGLGEPARRVAPPGSAVAACRVPVVGGMPLVGPGARRAAPGDATPGLDPAAIEVRRDRHRGGGRAGPAVRRISHHPHRRCGHPAARGRAGGANLPRLPPAGRPRLPAPDPADLRDALARRRKEPHDRWHSNSRSATPHRPSSCRTPTAHRTLAAERAARRSSCSPATTARMRWHGTTGSPPRRATTRTAACASCDQPQRRRAAIPRDSYEAMQKRVARRRLAAALPARREPGGRARLRRQDDAGRVRGRRRRAAALPRRPRRRLPRRAQNAAWLRGALDAVLAGETPSRPKPSRSAAASSGNAERRRCSASGVWTW